MVQLPLCWGREACPEQSHFVLPRLGPLPEQQPSPGQQPHLPSQLWDREFGNSTHRRPPQTLRYKDRDVCEGQLGNAEHPPPVPGAPPLRCGLRGQAQPTTTLSAVSPSCSSLHFHHSPHLSPKPPPRLSDRVPPAWLQSHGSSVHRPAMTPHI